jgi:hypothetical protein
MRCIIFDHQLNETPMERFRFEKRITTPEDGNYNGVTFSLFAECEDENYPDEIDGPTSPFDDDQAEAERYCLEHGVRTLWDRAEVWDYEVLRDDTEWTDYLELNDR